MEIFKSPYAVIGNNDLIKLQTKSGHYPFNELLLKDVEYYYKDGMLHLTGTEIVYNLIIHKTELNDFIKEYGEPYDTSDFRESKLSFFSKKKIMVFDGGWIRMKKTKKFKLVTTKFSIVGKQ